MFKDLPEEENHKKTAMLLEHELRAAVRIIGYLVEQAGGEVTLPHQILGVDRRVQVQSSALDQKIHLKSFRGDQVEYLRQRTDKQTDKQADRQAGKK